MHTIRARGVPTTTSELAPSYGGLLDWEGARVFLEVVRCGSFRSAAEALHISVNTLRRRIEEFERRLGLVLLTRHVDGVRMTTEGELVLAAAKRMEAASFDFMRARNHSLSMHGEVRLSITEGLGTFWVAPRLVEFQRAHPNLLVDMRCTMHPADVLRLETDVAIQITRPSIKDLRIVKLGRLHAMPFASQEYLSVFGVPRTLADLANHRVVLQVSDQITSTEEYARLFPNQPQIGHVALRANVSSAHYWAIARGAGIGMLPTYGCAMAEHIVPVDVGILTHQDIWLTYHPDASKIGRVRRLIDWLIDAFSPKKYPWFGDEFIHPHELPIAVNGTAISELFGGFQGIKP